ncbi:MULTISPECIES: MFS transporter [Brevibacillus]|uniref:MFS transporter n=1 Tax=Brevibacillus TaxID=55080 RepID=UPI00156B6F1F|nr:MFS transporter [Brevibacillus sp. RS1.1]NRR04678.1 MFS transporter [Brevibacillus sp. RS1.1]
MEAVPKQSSLPSADTSRLFTKPFTLLWMSALCSGLSISLFLFSQTWYIIQVLSQEASLGIVFMAATIPRIVFMLIGGTLADRMSKKRILSITSMLKAFLMLLLGGIIWWGYSSLALFIWFALFFGTIDAFYWPAQNSFIPSIVPSSSLLRANSVLQTTNQTSQLLGPVLAGFVIEWGSYPLLYGFVGLLLLVASVSAWCMPKQEPAVLSKPQQRLKESIEESFCYVKQSDFLPLLLTSIICLNVFLMGPLYIGLPIFVDQVLAGSTLQYSFLEGALAFGMLAGAIVLTLTTLGQNRLQIAFLFMIMQALVFFAFSLTQQFWLSLLILFTLGVTFSLINVPILSFVQEKVPQASLGKVMSLVSLSSLGLQPISQAITSLLIACGLTAKEVMLLASIPLFLASCFFYWRQKYARPAKRSD